MCITSHRATGPGAWPHAVARGVIIGVLLAGAGAASPAAERNGQAVVDAVCRDCHGPGKDGAPRIGDAKAWSGRAAQGLSALTAHAIEGIRKMPAHGGGRGVSDTELSRAIAYMVNQSGGNWVEPIDPAAAPVARSGAEIVQMRCANCHESGANGAPRIGDKAAWVPRLKNGIGGAVRSAINGHGGMPARGGLPDLTDAEVRSAVTYMFLPTAASARQPVGTAVAAPGGHRKTVDGVDVYLGIVPAETLRRQVAEDGKRQPPAPVPSGRDVRYVSVSLFDAASKTEIADAWVEAAVRDPAMGGQTHRLDVMVVNGRIGYGNYFRVAGTTPYKVALHIVRPDTGQQIDTEFEIRR